MTQPRTVTPLLLSNHETRVWQVMHTGWIFHVMTVQTSPRTHSRKEETLQSGGPRRVRRRAQCLVTGRVHGTPPVSGSLTGPSTDHPLRDPPLRALSFRGDPSLVPAPGETTGRAPAPTPCRPGASGVSTRIRDGRAVPRAPLHPPARNPSATRPDAGHVPERRAHTDTLLARLAHASEGGSRCGAVSIAC